MLEQSEQGPLAEEAADDAVMGGVAAGVLS